MGDKRVENLNKMIVNTSVISNMFGCTERWVRQLAQDGIIDRKKSGSYELLPTVRKYVNYLKLTAESNVEDIEDEADLQKEKTLHERAKRKIAEMELALMKGSLHKSENVELVMTDMLSGIKSKLMAIPSKMAPVLSDKMEIAVIEDLLTDEIYSILEELADYKPELFRGDEYVEIEGDRDDDIDGENG